MAIKLRLAFTAFLAAVILLGATRSSSQTPILTTNPLQQENRAPIHEIVYRQIADKTIVGAAVEIGQGGTVVYREAFGYREIEPRPVSMTPDTPA